MRVLYVSKASRVAAHRGKLARLSEHVDLTLLVPERWGGEPLEEGSPGRYEMVRLPTLLHGHNHLHVYRGLRRVLPAGAFDLVHVDEEPYSLVTAQVAARAARLGVPSLFFAWQNLDKRLPVPFAAMRNGVFRRVSGGIAGNQEAADVLRGRGFAGPLAVIPQMGVDPEIFRPDPSARSALRNGLQVGDAGFLVGYVGRLVPEKGVADLLDALAELPGARAVIVGDGPERRALEERAGAPDLNGRVYFAGAVPSLEMPRWLAALDCLVLPSRTTPGWKEQFGRVLVEAMACGVSVVGSDSGEIPRVIGDAGGIVPEGDGEALQRELRALAERPELRAGLGRKGRARVLASYTQERVVTDTLSFYRELLSASPGEAARPTRPVG
jgi:glycosyltransferase involved in cell wall biosynthesis